MYRQISVSNAQIHDNLESDGTAVGTDLEAIMSAFAYASMNKGMCVFPLGCMSGFHGRFIENPNIKKQNGDLYLSNIKIKEFINFVSLLLIEKILKKQKYSYQITILLFMKCLANILSMVKSSKKEWIRGLPLKRSLKYFI